MRFVKTSTANRVPSSRPCALACEVASSTQALVAAVDHLAEEALEVDRLGRVEPGRPRLAADAPLDVRQQPGLAAGGLEDRVEQERGRRLPVRAGDAGDASSADGSPKKSVGGDRHRRPRVRDDELRQVDRDGMLDDERGRAQRRRGRRERVPVGVAPAHAEEERARA